MGSMTVVNVQDYIAQYPNAPDDRRAVYEAIDAARQSGGGTVFFPRGNYRLWGDTSGTAPWEKQAYLKLSGAFYDITLLGEPGALLLVYDAGASPHVVLLEGVQRFTLRALTFGYVTRPTIRDDVKKAVKVTGATDLLIDGCEVREAAGYGIGVETSERVTVRNCRLHDTLADGANFWTCTKVRAEGNTVYRTGDDGIAIVTPDKNVPSPAYYGEESVVTGNTIYFTNSRGIFVVGRGVTVTGNAVSDTSGANIAVLLDNRPAADPGATPVGITITGNTCRRAATVVGGADIENPPAGYTGGTGPGGGARHLHGTDGAGAIEVAEVFQDAGNFSTTLEYPTAIAVSGNIIYDSGRAGVVLQHTRLAAVTGNVIYNPMVTDHVFPFGVYLRDCAHVVVSGNAIYRWARAEANNGLLGSNAIAQTGSTNVVIAPDNNVVNASE